MTAASEQPGLDDAFFVDFLSKVETVTNSQPFLLHFMADITGIAGPELFGLLLAEGLLKRPIVEYLELIEHAHVEDEEIFYFRSERLERQTLDAARVPRHKHSVNRPEPELDALTPEQLRLGLLCALTQVRHPNPHGPPSSSAHSHHAVHLHSPYSTYLEPAEANKLVDHFLEELNKLGRDWTYHFCKPASFDPLAPEGVYFLTGFSSCLFFHDGQANALVFLATCVS